MLQAGDSYTSFINKLKSEKISLPPHNPRQRQQTLATSSTNTNDSSTTVGRPFVPPICAPAQTRDIPVSTAASNDEVGKCAYWPICKKNRRDCGGYSKDLCRTYGINGTETSPSEKQLQQQIRLHTWSDHWKKRKCWYPYCGNAVDCGGASRDKCSTYGIGGTTTQPSESELKDAKAKAKREAEKTRKHRKRNSIIT